MLLMGLTGGIGAGKSTVSRLLSERGALVVDADTLARQVVARGSDGLAEIIDRFGPTVITAEGDLDRPLMASIVFADPVARAELEAITHPRITAAAAQAFAAAPPGAVVVYDMPLLVEMNLSADYHLVLVVHVESEERLRRLVQTRGMSPDDVRARMAAQADDTARGRVADIWLDNTGPVAELTSCLNTLWEQRLVPFAANLAARRPAARLDVTPSVPADPTWPQQAARLMARIAKVAGADLARLQHVGPTATPGVSAPDVIDLDLDVRRGTRMDQLGDSLTAKGFPLVSTDDAGHQVRAAADPGRAALLRVRRS